MATTKRARKAVTASGESDRKIDSEHQRRPQTSAPKQGKRSTASPPPGNKPSVAGKPTLGAKRGATNPSDRKGSPHGAAVAFRSGSKGAAVIALLNQKDGATIAKLTEATGWQAHSVRGFLSGSLRKKRGVAVTSYKDDKGQRRYRIAT